MCGKQKWKAIVFDCKGFEFYFAKFKTKKSNELFPWERESLIRLKVRNYMPSFAYKKAQDYKLFDSPRNYFLKDFKVFSYQLSDIKDILEASTLGLAPQAKIIFLDRIRAKIKEERIRHTEDLLKLISRSQINHFSKTNLLNVFSFFLKEKLFDPTKKSINIKRDWREGNLVNISLLEPEENMASFYAGKIISDLYDQDVFQGTHKLIFFDDAHKLIGYDMKSKEYLSVKRAIDTLVLGRYKKWDLMFATQSFSLINPLIFPHMKYKIVGKLGSRDIAYLSNFCSPDVINAVKSLRYDPVINLKEF